MSWPVGIASGTLSCTAGKSVMSVDTSSRGQAARPYSIMLHCKHTTQHFRVSWFPLHHSPEVALRLTEILSNHIFVLRPETLFKENKAQNEISLKHCGSGSCIFKSSLWEVGYKSILGSTERFILIFNLGRSFRGLLNISIFLALASGGRSVWLLSLCRTRRRNLGSFNDSL